MNSEAEYDKIVGALYDAALHPQTWKQAFADLAAWSGADVFHFVRWDTASQQAPFNLHTDGIENAIEQYGAYYGAIDPRRILVSDGPAGQVSACQRHFDERYVSRNEFYQDYLVPWGMRHTLSSLVLHEGSSQMLLGLVRARERGSFDDAQIARLDRVMPHLARACRLWTQTQHLHDAAALGQHVASSSGFAVFGLDAAGRVVYSNSHAERLLREADSLVVHRGRLSATDLRDAALVHDAVVRAAAGSSPQTFAVTGLQAGPQACFLTVASLPEGTPLSPLLGQARVLVTARRRGQPSAVSPEQLTQVFGLTPAECGVALALLDGKTPAEYAQDKGLSMPTVRTHLRAVFAKTNTRGQSEAVRLLQDLP